jgi:hypothetical protein
MPVLQDETYAASETVGVIHITVLHCDVEITGNNKRGIGIVTAGNMIVKSFEPLKLVLEFVRPHLKPLGHVNVYNRYVFDCAADKSGLLITSFKEIKTQILHRGFADNRNAVV